MADAILRIKTVMDVGDVVSNVGTIQKALGKLKLPDNLKDNLNKNIGSFYKEYEKYQKKLTDGLKTQGDFNQVEKSLNRMRTLYSEIGKDAAKAVKIDPEALFNLDEGKFKNIANKIEQTLQKLSNLKIDKKPFEDAKKEIESLSKNQKIVGNEGILAHMMGHIETGEIGKAKQEYTNLINEVKKAAPIFDEMGNRISKPGTFNVAHYQQLQSILSKLGTSFSKAGADVKPLEEELNRLQQEMAETVTAASKDLVGNVNDYNKQAASVEKVTDSLKHMHEEEYNFNRQAQDIDRQIQSYFGLSQMIRKVADIARDAFATVKDLDAAMVETAVVTNFDVGDMWDMLPTYTANANQLGSTIKDVYEAATLYYQQGLNQAQSMGLANETLKMARIGGLQAADATNMMTAALRGFNMEINQVSAKRINDVYSELAAITAADTKEIGSAMERTASIANSANMQFETTSAFLAQMIETTREAPENLGTAMKTIIARFQEMKQDPTKLVDSEGVALDANKIDTALKTIGVDLKNQKGEFRDLDTVFLEISEKWDSLTQGQQRYIATIAAGSRQQSRFIAMMQNYERVKELVDAANNSAGASQKQFEKTLDSMSSKLNRLKNAWDQFTMGLMNNQILKGGVDALTGFFTVVNKIFDVLTKPFPDPFGGLIKSAITLTSTLALLNLGKKGARGAVMAGVGWWKGEGNIAQNFASGWGGANAAKAGTQDGRIYAQKFNEALKGGQFKDAFVALKNQVQEMQGGKQYQNTFQAAFGQFSAKELSAGWSSEIENEIRTVFQRASQSVDASVWGNTDANEYIEGLIRGMKSGELSAAEAANALKIKTGGKVDVTQMGVYETTFPKASKNVKDFGKAITGAGSSLQMFGAALQATPLAPFGSMLSMIGGLLSGVGGAVTKVTKAWSAGMKAMKVETAATSNVVLASLTKMKLGVKAFLLEIGPIGWAILAITAGVAAFKVLDKAITTSKEKLEQTSDAAAKASEAFDSAKQETSELQDTIARIRETDSAFDKLVAGTADFNEQLVTANEQITALINKYPMLLEEGKNYITTDANGLMHISEEGLKAVEDYQKQIQARASATNIIQAADLAALENQQKADKLMRDWGDGKEDHDKNVKEAELLRQRADAEKEVARRNAIRTVLNGQEIKDVEAISALYSNLYEEKRKVAETNLGNKQDIRQQYADYHGYKYNQSTKKMTDTEGNEVEYDDAVIKDEVIEQTVLLDFEENAATLDNVLNNLDSRFNETLGDTFENSSNFISDLLGSNIDTNTDLLKDVLSDSSTQLSDLVQSMSDEELAAILGVTQSEVGKNLDKYQKQAVDLLTERASSIVEAQSKNYAELGRMMAQASDVGFAAASTNTIQSSISKQISELSTQQANTLSTIGQALETNVGPETMETFIGKASDIYLKQGDNVAKQFDGILNEINWESPTSRLQGYHEAINSSNKSIQEWGKSMRSSADEANILGDAFDEFLGGEWTELSEHADEFQNAMGEIDSAGILKASEQSKTLKGLLDSGEVSATGLAKALQGVQDGAISQVNSTVLQLLSSLNRLNDVAAEAHNIIENFDAGIDTGEGEDFVKENAEKFKEYYDNEEYGNEQLQNYLKLAAGTDRWNQALKDNHGSIEGAVKDLDHYVTTFSDGFMPAWEQMIGGKGINGKTLVENIEAADISDGLKKKFKEVDFTNEDGYLNVDIGQLTTSELETYFQEIYGVSQEYAKLLMQDLANYNTEIGKQLAANDLQSTIGSDEFQQSHLDRNGNLTLSDADIQAFKDAGGSMDQLKEAAGGTIQTFEVLNKEGERSTDYTKLLQNFDEVFGTGVGSIKSLLTEKSLQGRNESFDLEKLISTVQTKAGFDQEQAMQSAWAAYKRAEQEGKTTSYGDMTLEKGIQSYEEFQSAISEVTETSKWVPIGQAIAQGFMNYINGGQNSDVPPGTQVGGTSSLNLDATQANEEIDGVNERWRQTNNDINNNPAKLDGDSSQANEDIETVNSAWGQVVQSGVTNPLVVKTDTKKADEDIERVRTSYGELVNDGKTNPIPVKTQPETTNKKGEPTKDTKSTYAVDVSGQEKVQALQEKITQLNTIVKAGGTYTLSVTGVTKAQKAASAAAKITKNQGTKSIKVKTGKVDTSSVTSAQGKIDNTKGTIQVGANTSEAISKANKAAAAINKKKASISVSASVTGSWSKDFTINVKVNKKKVGSTTVSGGSGETSHRGGFITPNGTQYRAKGGQIFQKKYTDTVPAMLTPGEYVQRTAAVKFFGVDFMRKINHMDLAGAIQTLGSVARGRYGRLGPNGKGGLTLTGEKGFEIAWLPNESRSMILGVNGPQMANLPSDAVVYTHEQSKKIIKQKSIPAGSHANTSRKITVSSGGSGSSSGSKKSSGSSGSKKSSGSSSSKKSSSETKIIIEYSGDVSVWWENQTRKVDATQRKVDSLLKKFEDELKRIGTTRKSIQSITNSYKKQLNRSIALNKTSKKVAEKGLYNLNYSTSSSKRTISYNVTEKTTKKDKKGKTTTSYNKKSKETKVSLSKYIKYDKTNDTYVIDQDAIDRVSKGYYYKDSKGNRKWAQGNASKGKAIKEAAEKEINDKLSKRNTAIDNITKAQEALKKINNDIYESFYRWEKSITRVYILSQKLEELTKRLSIAGSQAELQFAKLEAGINKNNGLTKIKEALTNERELLLSQAKAQNTNVNAAKVAFQNSLNFSTYVKKYLNNPNSTEAKGDYLAAKKAFDLLDKLNFENGEFNYASAIAALNKKQYNEETNNRIKDVLDKIFEKQNDYLDAINDAYQAQTEIYQKMEEMQSFIAEFEQDLLSGIEEQAEDQVRRLDKLNSALSKAFKDLIDEVKSRLDDRRKKEDNAKTESDIAKKQQRLAALRADTSGGHAVEIAQLEKEIAEAQQNYQRTLEDQLLERLQEQGDKAEKQRQRQIDLLELQNEIAKQTGSNLAEVKEWLKNPEANKEQIRQAWLANKDYDEAAPGERTRLEQEFESEWAKYLAYNAQLPKYQDTVTSKMDKLESTLNSIAKNLLKVTGSRSARELRQAGLSAKQLRKLGYSAKSLKSGGYTAKELKNAGYSAKSIRKAGYSIQDFRKAGFSAKQAVKAGYSKEKTIKAYNYTAAKGMIDLNASGKTVQKAKGVSAKQIQKIINKNPKDDATQKDLAGVQVGKVDVNGKKKGGEIKDSHISATGKRVGANSGSYLYTANWDTNKGKITGGWTTWKLSEFTADLIKKYPIDASQALVYAIQNREIGSFLNKNFKSLVSAAKISGKEYKLNDRSITGTIGANGYIYYNTSSGDVKRWDPAKGKLETITYDKAKFLKYAKQNNTYSKVYAQALIKKGAYTKSQLQKNGVKKFATGGLADSTGLAWLDGTPSKPELVLDAQDTKNFLTLRDVLDKAIGSTNAVENTYGGDTSYEININVDHINNDYDVDRIAERVEKKIIKNANYRNVVRVRNLR